VALAGMVATELVSAVGSDRWWQAQNNVDAWTRQFRPELAVVTRAELEALRCTALIARHTDDKDMLAALAAAWRQRLAEALDGRPAAADGLRWLLAEGLTAETPADWRQRMAEPLDGRLQAAEALARRLREASHAGASAAPGTPGGDGGSGAAAASDDPAAVTETAEPADATSDGRSTDEDASWEDDAVSGATMAYLMYRRLATTATGAQDVDCEAYQLRCLLLMCWGSLRVGKVTEAAEAAVVALEIHDRVAGRTPTAGPASPATRLTGGLAGLGSWLPEPILRSEGDILAEAAEASMRHLPDDPRLDPKARVFGAAAAALWRRLAAGEPARYGPLLAITQYELSAILRRLGRIDEAIGATSEACEIWRGLADTHPDGSAIKLHEALWQLHQLREEQGQLELAAAVAAEQVELHRGQTARDPGWPPILLAAALLTSGEDLVALGRDAEAVPVMREATDVYRRLAAGEPDRFEEFLGLGLGTLYGALWRLSRPEEAVAVCAECVAVFRRLAAQDPDRLGGFLASSASNHGFYLSSLGRHGEALAATAEAVRARRNRAATRPVDLAFTLWTFAEVRLAARAELPQATTAIAEAAEIYGDLAKTAPERYGDSLRQVLTMAGDIAALR